MKKILLLIVLMVMMFVPAAFAKEMPVEVFINYVELENDQPAVLNKEFKRIYLPLRAVAERLGAEVEWAPKPENALKDKHGNKIPEVHITTKKGMLRIPIGSKEVWLLDGNTSKSIEIEAPAYIEKATNRTMVPLSFVSEALGTEVRWGNKYKVIYIIDPDKPMGMIEAKIRFKQPLTLTEVDKLIKQHKITPIAIQYIAIDGSFSGGFGYKENLFTSLSKTIADKEKEIKEIRELIKQETDEQKKQMMKRMLNIREKVLETLKNQSFKITGLEVIVEKDDINKIQRDVQIADIQVVNTGTTCTKYPSSESENK
ncbi:stalk domain-containing protein [Peptococcaceae bacterium]|nr:stalk domain-containing protein [Peptococcaceae bacterium]